MIKQTIKEVVKRTFLYNIYYTLRNKLSKKHRKWLKAQALKQLTVKEYAQKHKLRIFVETGTCLGDMVYAVKDVFNEIKSIELGEELFKRAKKRFCGEKHITIYQGNSAEVLPIILASIKNPCLFWLDAHYSGGSTVKGTKNTPIREELHHIFSHWIKGHVILIDDARCFTGKDDYPSIDELRNLVASYGLSLDFEVKDDIIRILE